jgi:hypothetical protein
MSALLAFLLLLHRNLYSNPPPFAQTPMMIDAVHVCANVKRVSLAIWISPVYIMLSHAFAKKINNHKMNNRLPKTK